jgi:hypothetical protein
MRWRHPSLGMGISIGLRRIRLHCIRPIVLTLNDRNMPHMGISPVGWYVEIVVLIMNEFSVVSITALLNQIAPGARDEECMTKA